MSNPLKGDPTPKNYEQMYLDLIENIDNMGFKISLDMKNLKAQYLSDKQARAQFMNEQFEEEHKKRQKDKQEDDGLPDAGSN